ncbi:galactokinase [Mucilaginibacter pallidiroseus]|uniref:Galactokinase n=1 Tax=Mucilaginibacter pallidiroseus TaxID=2599295 RepID=A0A563UCK4_9SPHI|nr:galactokinase [Mucilaginibacter pallidiroseus]TWR29013.1 galactokinase [Mucilaginibacter pallidiroseus]
MKNQLQQQFKQTYNKSATHSFFSPGRVNLIGEHIDYNGGLVMPCAVTFGTYLLVAPNDDNVFRFKSINFPEEGSIEINADHAKQGSLWYNYPTGVISYFLQQNKTLGGLDMLYYGDIPIASGLSSSASIEVVTAFALNQIFDAGFSKLDLVLLSKWVENVFIGLNSGIMDQFSVTFGEQNKALMLNCDTLEYEAVHTNLGEYVLAIINTNKPRKLAESKYNERVEECAEALQALKQELYIKYLCDIDTDTYNKYQHLLTDQTVNNRARHVIEENDRVKLAAEALSGNNLEEFGRLMYASHNSLRDLYEVSGIELDTVVEYAATNPDVIGARMTGAGFGGCAIALVKGSAFDKFSAEVTEYYTNKIGYAPSVYKSLIGNGVSELKQEQYA